MLFYIGGTDNSIILITLDIHCKTDLLLKQQEQIGKVKLNSD